MKIYEYIIVATDGYRSHKIDLKQKSVEYIEFSFFQIYLKEGCRLVEFDSSTEVYAYAKKGFEEGFPNDKENWYFFSKE